MRKEIQKSQIATAIYELATEHRSSRNAIPIKEARRQLINRGFAISDRAFRKLVKEMFDSGLDVVCMPKGSSFGYGLCYATFQDMRVYAAYIISHGTSEIKHGRSMANRADSRQYLQLQNQTEMVGV